ncbi:unnamed protein product, partial [Candidula unifasciata]
FARFFTFTWEYGEILCKAVHYFQNLTIICSVLNLIGLSFERYYAILHPMRAKYMCTVTIARRLVILIWSLSVVMALPILVGQRQRLVGGARKGYWCVEDWDSPLIAKVYNLYMFVVAYVLPLTLMTLAYTNICRRLWQVKYQHPSLRATHSYMRPDRDPSSPEESLEVCNFLRSSTVHREKIRSVNEESTRRQVVKMLVFVVALFAICWGPIMFNNVLVAFHVLQPLHHGYLKPMRQGFWLMGYVNSCLNPIVYGFMSKNFRESFRNTVSLCVLGRDISRHRTLCRCTFNATT